MQNYNIFHIYRGFCRGPSLAVGLFLPAFCRGQVKRRAPDVQTPVCKTWCYLFICLFTGLFGTLSQSNSNINVSNCNPSFLPVLNCINKKKSKFQETTKEDKVTLTTANVTISGPADKELSLHGSLDETLPSTNTFSPDINVVQQSNNNITTIRFDHPSHHF